MISAEQGLCGGRGERFPRRLGFALVASRCGRGWQAPAMRARRGCAIAGDWVRARLSVVVRS